MWLRKGTLLFVLDGQKLLAFRNDGDADTPVLTTLKHRRLENPRSSELGTDSPGRAFASTGQQRSSYQETDWHKQAEERLAIESAETIQQIAAEEPGKIIVIADPRSLGTLRKHYDAAIRQRIEAEIDKDLTNLTADRIGKSIVRYNEPV